ncbi:MAG: DUF4390 domain-containing protein [Zoogloeaceae bacterium]|nr:DUF4390 domain-containing protein [Zoogloeaceae bacterium]
MRNASLIVLAVLALAAQAALAGVIEPTRSQLTPTEEGYVLSAGFNIELGDHLEEALMRGVTLAFTLEFNIERKRWYWFDERIAGRTLHYRLSYNALTQQYRLSTGGLYSSYATLSDVLRVLGHVNNLVVADLAALTPDNTYVAELRLDLDKSQLPKPLQLDALASKTWQVNAKTVRWEFTAGVLDQTESLDQTGAPDP